MKVTTVHYRCDLCGFDFGWSTDTPTALAEIRAAGWGVVHVNGQVDRHYCPDCRALRGAS